MLKKLLTPGLFLFFVFTVAAQQKSHNEPFYVNVYVSAGKTIYVETEKTNFEDVPEVVSGIIRNKPFIPDQKIIYRIFGDESLKIGYIMDVNEKMRHGYSENFQTQKYLLNTMELNIDGRNWFESINMDEMEEN